MNEIILGAFSSLLVGFLLYATGNLFQEKTQDDQLELVIESNEQGNNLKNCNLIANQNKEVFVDEQS